MSDRSSNSQASANRYGSGDPMASIRPALPQSPPLVAATVELSDLGERDPTGQSGAAIDLDLFAGVQETHESGPFTIPVLEAGATESSSGANSGSGSERDGAPYALLERIGEGGMGEVWQARQRALGRIVALKRLHEGKRTVHSIIRQFESEARLTGALDHPNIVTVHELGRDQTGRVFYTMKRIEGTAWSEVIASSRRRTGDGAIVELELRDHLEILLEVSQAIAFAHSRGVIHRDIKPANVMIGDYGEVLVVDWGLAVALRPLATLGGAETWTLAELPRSALVCGTPAYMSPETAKAARARIGPATDVYLLGAVLFHVLYGRPPHKGKTVQEVIATARANGWSYPSAIPPEHQPWDALLRPVINRALASDPSLRFADGGAFGEALRESLRNYDSAKLAARAERKLAAMDLYGVRADGGYQAIAAIIAQLEGALESWPRNLAARRTLAQAHLELASLALANGDLALAKISVDQFEKLPPLPAREPERAVRRITLHPVDATLIGAPRLSDSLVAIGTSNQWVSSGAPNLRSELSRTIGAAEIVSRRRAISQANGVGASLGVSLTGDGEDPKADGQGPAASVSVDIQQATSDALLDDELELVAKASRLRDGIHEHERELRKRRRALSVVAGLVATLVTVVIVFSTLGALALQSARDQAQDERNQLSRVLLQEAASTTEARLEILFKPVHGVLSTSVLWARAGVLDVDDPARLNTYFMPLLEGVETATSMLRADAAGFEYMLLRREQGWRTRTTAPDQAPQLDEWTAHGSHERSSTDDRPYNPHTRPWYIGGAALRDQGHTAQSNGDSHPVHWTAPYQFFTTGELGISVSAPATSVSGREFVLGFDVKLGDISTFTRDLPVGIDQGQVFVLDEQLRVIGLPKETRHLSGPEQEALMLRSLADLVAAPVCRAVFLHWRAGGQSTEPFRFEFGPDQVYWVGFRHVDLGDRPKMWIGVVVPESHFLSD